MRHCTEYKLSALQVAISEEKNQRYNTAAYNCKNIRLPIKTGE